MLYPKKTKNPNPSPSGNRVGFFLFGGRGWIRTTEAEKQQIYSLSPLATREHAQIQFLHIRLTGRLAYFSMESGICQHFFAFFAKVLRGPFESPPPPGRRPGVSGILALDGIGGGALLLLQSRCAQTARQENSRCTAFVQRLFGFSWIVCVFRSRSGRSAPHRRGG